MINWNIYRNDVIVYCFVFGYIWFGVCVDVVKCCSIRDVGDGLLFQWINIKCVCVLGGGRCFFQVILLYFYSLIFCIILYCLIESKLKVKLILFVFFSKFFLLIYICIYNVLVFVFVL